MKILRATTKTHCSQINKHIPSNDLFFPPTPMGHNLSPSSASAPHTRNYVPQWEHGHQRPPRNRREDVGRESSAIWSSTGMRRRWGERSVEGQPSGKPAEGWGVRWRRAARVGARARQGPALGPGLGAHSLILHIVQLLPPWK